MMMTMVTGTTEHVRHSSRDLTNTKGLLNAPGQNNCFLNSAVQVLWHLDIFRRSFRELSGHACMGNACIFCALKELFSQLQFSNERALPCDEVRRALAAEFCGQRRFRLGCMADAAECFENILLRLHAHAALTTADDNCNHRDCLPHRKFAMSLVEQGLCSACGATSNRLPFTQMVHYVSASALTTQARQTPATLTSNGRTCIENFGDLLKRAGGMGDVRDCPSACGAKTQICRSLMNKPEIVSVGVVWDSERPTLEHIMDVFSTIGTTLTLKDLFHSVAEQTWAAQTVHHLVGVVTYYGKHYSTFFFHTKLRMWIYFDDATVKEVGPRWEQVVDKCRKGRYQPLLLLYSVEYGADNNRATAYTNQSVLRRSVTPSPEKPTNGNTRRAITPNPDRPPMHRPYNEYQNLAVIQDNLYGKRPVDDTKRNEPEYISRKTVENVLNAQNAKKQQLQLHRSLSTGSTANSGDGIVVPDHLNVPRRRDSGNWSGDRNSTSSSSSTTMENPYLYLVGKMQQRNGSVPSSPTRKGEIPGGRYDAGYDSYSLSSTDSLPLQQGLKHNLQLAQIPEYQPHAKGFGKPPLTQDDCGRLCMEADQLLDKSRQIEDTNDLETALVLCNAAASKARAAMDAPYNNPHMMTFARMKHNTCIMRARSLHRRILQEQGFGEKDSNVPDVRHTREGSNSSARHSRQNSRDKSSHSRQNSKEMLAPAPEKTPPNKNIEIYATLPKKKSLLKKSPQTNDSIEDAEYMIYDRPNRESRSIFGRSKNKDEEKGKEKRSRSEDRSKASKEMSIAPDSLKKDKHNKEEKGDKDKDKDKPGKKQHKIRRKLLMGGLIRRKNRSMPDLTEGNVDDNNKSMVNLKSVDDSGLGLKAMDKNLSGYLSEGHLEYSGASTTNPNLERSKLMRKSFHGSAGKILTIAKVPPPPPLRTTSQLSGPKHEDARPQYPLPDFPQNYNFSQDKNLENISDLESEPQSLPLLLSYDAKNQGMVYDTTGFQTVVTKADIHQENSPIKQEPVNVYPVSQHVPNKPVDDGVDEVDCIGVRIANLDLPPYPSPPNSVLHSRQASEDFPPPPPPLDNEISNESSVDNEESSAPATGLLAQLQQKRQQILSSENSNSKKNASEETRSSGETWLKELQAKQAALKLKRAGNINEGASRMNIQQINSIKRSQSLFTELVNDDNSNLVRNIASKFEFTKPNYIPGDTTKERASPYNGLDDVKSNFVAESPNTYVSDSTRRISESSIDKHQIEEELREVELVNAAVNRQLSQNLMHNSTDTLNSIIESKVDNILRTKKKSVSFCDQVILVATAEDQEENSYLPNPILERVLKSTMNKSDQCFADKPSLKRQDSIESQKSTISTLSHNSVDNVKSPEYVKVPSVYQHLSNFNNSNGSDVTKSTENVFNQPPRLVAANPPYQPIPTGNVQNNIIPPTSIYQSPPISNTNNAILTQKPPPHKSPVLSSASPIYQSHPIFSNNYQNQPSHLYPQNAQYTSQQSMNLSKQAVVNSSVANQHLNAAASMYQQKQNSMYFPVNRTQPAYQNSNANQYQNSTSPYLPLPTATAQYTQINDTSSLNGNYDPDRISISKYSGIVPNLIKNESHSVIGNNQQSTYNSHNNSVNSTITYNNNQSNPAMSYNNPSLAYNNQINTHFNNSSYTQNVQTTVPTYNTHVNNNHTGAYNANSNNSYNQYNSPYQRVPQLNSENQSHNVNSASFQKTNSEPLQNSPYHRIVQNPNDPGKFCPQYNNSQYNYQQESANVNIQSNRAYQTQINQNLTYIAKQPPKKSVSFEPGTKGGTESPVPNKSSPAMANSMPNGINTNLSNQFNGNLVSNNHVVNGVNSSSQISKSLCNLCRKKYVNPPSIYCIDCDFYMSRFKPRT